MALTDPHAPGATPLTPVQLRGLRLPLTTHGELNAAEQENILRARLWARGARSIASERGFQRIVKADSRGR